MRARYADREGYVDRGRVSLFYEVYENDGPTVVLVPTPTILNSRQWNAQIHHLSRRRRLVTFDGRGNGQSDKPDDVEMCRSIKQPVLVIHGTEDRCQPLKKGVALAELTGGTLLEIEGGGHGLMGREPVKANRETNELR